MAVLLGFLIAIAIGVTGVGGGILTAPILILFLGMPPVEAVTIALVFAAAVKLLIAPAYIWRKQVDFRILGKLLLGGLPGVLAGSLLLERLSAGKQSNVLYAVLGLTIALAAGVNLYRLRKQSVTTSNRDRSGWLPLLALPIGAEVGFSSAGAGALGTLALMSLTTLTAAQVVATDVLFGLGLSLVGGGLHWTAGHGVPDILWMLLAGGLAGSFVGVYLSGAIPARPLRAVLCLWLIVIGCQLCLRGFR
jgi:uncharacterized membrane protein YfcA